MNFIFHPNLTIYVLIQSVSCGQCNMYVCLDASNCEYSTVWQKHTDLYTWAE